MATELNLEGQLTHDVPGLVDLAAPTKTGTLAKGTWVVSGGADGCLKLMSTVAQNTQRLRLPVAHPESQTPRRSSRAMK